MVIGGGGQSREGEVVTLIQKSVGVLSVPNKGAILNLVLILGKFFRSTCKKVVLIDRAKKPVWKAREGDTANDW